jgi:hypothetical protein
VRLIRRDGDAIELAKARLPDFAHAAPADHHRGTQRADKRDIALVRPHRFHSVDVACDDRGNNLPTCSVNEFKVAGLLSLRRGHRSEQQSDDDEGFEWFHGRLLRNEGQVHN